MKKFSVKLVSKIGFNTKIGIQLARRFLDGSCIVNIKEQNALKTTGPCPRNHLREKRTNILDFFGNEG